MKYALLSLTLCLSFGLTACDQLNATEPNSVKLSASEKKEAIAIADGEQQLSFDQTAAQNEFQRRQNELNLKSQKLCAAVKKAHALDPRTQYLLDAYRGELRK